MRLLAIICVMLLASCGRDPQYIPVEPTIPADLLVPSKGWTGPTPQTEGQLIDAVEAEKSGREDANRKIKAISEIVDGL